MTDPWQSFKRQVGLVILYSAISYGVLITMALLVFGKEACAVQPLWAFLMNIISTVLGWLLAKAGTVVDHQYGTSKSSEEKTDFIIREKGVKPYEPTPKPPACSSGPDAPAPGRVCG